MNKKIILDLWPEYHVEIEYLNIMIDDGTKEEIIAQIYMTEEDFMNEVQEDLYNFCLEVAHDFGYILVGEVE